VNTSAPCTLTPSVRLQGADPTLYIIHPLKRGVGAGAGPEVMWIVLRVRSDFGALGAHVRQLQRPVQLGHVRSTGPTPPTPLTLLGMQPRVKSLKSSCAGLYPQNPDSRAIPALTITASSTWSCLPSRSSPKLSTLMILLVDVSMYSHSGCQYMGLVPRHILSRPTPRIKQLCEVVRGWGVGLRV